MGHKAFFFFHSALTPETLGIVCFVGVWALVAAASRDRLRSWAWLVPLLVLVAAGVLTQHLSALMTGLSLLLLAGVLSWRNERTAVEVFVLAATAMLLLAAWLFVHASTTTEYLVGGVHRAGSDRWSTSCGSRATAFARSTGGRRSPLGERILAAIYPLLVPSCAAAGIVVVLQRPAGARSAPLLLTLLIFGPILWVFTAPDRPRRRIGPRVPALAVPLPGRGDLRGARPPLLERSAALPPSSSRPWCRRSRVARDRGRDRHRRQRGRAASRSRRRDRRGTRIRSRTTPIAAARWLA